MCDLLHQDAEMCVPYAIAKMISKNFSLKKTIWCFVKTFAPLRRLLDTETIQLSGVFSFALQNLAKAVLLHNGNLFSSETLAHPATMKEPYENIELLLETIQYEKHNWNICGDFKVIAVLFGWPLGCNRVLLLAV
jgi:hypothetical protein